MNDHVISSKHIAKPVEAETAVGAGKQVITSVETEVPKGDEAAKSSDTSS